jgi:hypothetical protein
MVGSEHVSKNLKTVLTRLGKRECATGQGLVLSSIEHVQDEGGEKGMGGAIPMIPEFVSIGVNENVRNVLAIPHFIVAESHFLQGVPASRSGPSGIETENVAVELLTPEPGGEGEVFTFDVTDYDTSLPHEEIRYYQADAFAAPGGSENEEVVGSCVVERHPPPAVRPEAKKNTGWSSDAT